MTEPTLDSRQGWGRLARFYYQFRSEEGRFHQSDPARLAEALCMKSLLAAIDLRGKPVLDAGCGFGYYAFLAAEQGALVTAIDFAPEMVDLARRLARERGIPLDVQIGDVCDLSAFTDASFAAVISGMDLEVPDIAAAFQECARVTEDGGVFLFSVPHPIIHHGQWQCDDEARKLFFALDNYFERGPFEAEWADESGRPVRFQRFRRPLQDYTESLASSGFVIERLLEGEPTREQVGIDETLADELRRVPAYLTIQARKRGSG